MIRDMRLFPKLVPMVTTSHVTSRQCNREGSIGVGNQSDLSGDRELRVGDSEL